LIAEPPAKGEQEKKLRLEAEQKQRPSDYPFVFAKSGSLYE
jgi:hypothetical protein